VYKKTRRVVAGRGHLENDGSGPDFSCSRS